jgi:aminoacrylate hydrolase
MPTARITNGELYYETHGEGPPLVLSSGMGGLAAYWMPQLAEFAKHFRVVTYDQRGTGRSTHSEVDYSVELLAADLIELMDGLGIEKADAVGHSTGGMFMQAAAADHSARFGRIVLYGTRANTDYFTELAMGTRLEVLRNAGPAAFHRATPIFLYPSHWIRENRERLDKAAAASVAGSASVEIMASRIEAVLHHDQTARLHTIRSRALVVCAEDDYLTPTYYSRELAAQLPNAELGFVSWGGHACSQTNPDEFNRIVLAFLGAAAA